jgi:hypothetical protein
MEACAGATEWTPQARPLVGPLSSSDEDDDIPLARRLEQHEGSDPEENMPLSLFASQGI